MNQKYLKPNAIAEPLINQWYAWAYLIPPATAAMYITNHIKIMESFIESPKVHQSALKNPAMLGGPFIDHELNRVEIIKALLKKTKIEQANLLAIATAIHDLEKILRQADGHSLEPLYQQIPKPLKGYVELVYDLNNQPSIRYIEKLLYWNPDYRTARQTVALSLTNEDARSFVLSTPRLPESLHFDLPFAHRNWDSLFQMRTKSNSYHQISKLFEIDNPEFASLFTDEPPRQAPAYTDDAVRIRYFGHACVLLETRNISILCDPLVSYQHHVGIPRYTFTDLPEEIDYVLITHNHQDHVMFETLIQLRHKIKQVIVPKGNKGLLIDPSLKLILAEIGFSNVKEIDELETIEISDGNIIALPVLGEHGDLNIATKTAYWVNLKGKNILCAADSNNIEPELYQHLHRHLGNLDVLFIGMECDGAPFTWVYGALLTQSIPRKISQTRRLDGSDAEKAIDIVKQFHPQQVYVYAMGQEPWLTYITSIQYTKDSRPIVESDKLVAFCKQNGIWSERLFGAKEILLSDEQQAKFLNPELKSQMQLLPITQFLAELAQQDIKFSIEDTESEPRLKCNAPKGTLNSTLQAQIKARKSEIVDFLRDRSRKIDLAAEAVLDATIQPLGKSSGERNRILLTGATGFLGAFLLSELLQDNAQIYCLVRAENIESAQQRIKDCLQAYLLCEESFSTRIIPVIGDLSQPLLGLSKTQFQALVNEIDVIYHNGAYVHHTLPYSLLKAPNVLGTQEILRLACQGNKPIHFISTISVFAANPEQQIIRECDEVNVNSAPIGGYAQSKWVAEKLMTIARDRGFCVTIYRIGAIAGDSKTGVFNQNDFLYKLIQGCIQLGSAPSGSMMLNILPVDYVSRAIVALSRQSPSTYHLLHPQPICVDVLFDQLHAMGYKIQRVAYERWRELLLKIAETSPEHPLYAIASLFSPNHSPAADTSLQFDCAPTLTTLANTAITCPPIDAKLLKTYFSYLSKNGFLDAPQLV